MARKTKLLTIQTSGRDAGKVFYLEEFPAARIEDWGIRLVQAATRGGLDIPVAIAQQGALAMAIYGIAALGSMKSEDSRPLLAEMMECVKIVRDPARPEMQFSLMPDDIEEVGTLLKLREEVFELHTGFSIPGVLSKSPTPGQGQPGSNSTNTKTSPRFSARPSPRKRPR